MTGHLVETCPDDPAALKLRLDELAAEGAEIVCVVWQAGRTETEQSAAYAARGSFVIVARAAPGPLRVRDPAGDAIAERPA
jgi:hypothetical protein